MDSLGNLLNTLDQMVNDQFESVEFKNFLAVPLTLERGRFYVVQSALYTSNRRDCWAYVQGGAPLEVKRVIWEHESDELINAMLKLDSFPGLPLEVEAKRGATDDARMLAIVSQDDGNFLAARVDAGGGQHRCVGPVQRQSGLDHPDCLTGRGTPSPGHKKISVL